MNIFNTVKMTKNEKQMLTKLYDYLGMNTDAEAVSNDIMFGYLTDTTDSGNDYLWYMDENHDAAINLKTGDIIANASDILIG